MATFSNIEIRKVYADQDFQYPVAKSTVLAPGDLVEDDGSGNAQAVDTAELPVFVGVNQSYTSSTDVADLAITGHCVINVLLVSGSSDLSFGNGAKYNAGANGTDWNVTDATAEAVMHAIEAITNGNKGNFRVDVAGNSANGIFETLTT